MQLPQYLNEYSVSKEISEFSKTNEKELFDQITFLFSEKYGVFPIYYDANVDLILYRLLEEGK